MGGLRRVSQGVSPTTRMPGAAPMLKRLQIVHESGFVH